ncbi:hypothetical protein SAMN04488540_10673 [Ferrimonas sediminum]|uniref:Uncharacterized protein n=1 Tax=Ferrimonas sediminum TaxID=718193 RepID=A0A1G8S570_9GAMM|nr:hypothetical protein [Ferrimonas sediminum]SDJ24312.1 hypothetical protein SAMN04488540_10673 [Ferrimonas sediminum]
MENQLLQDKVKEADVWRRMAQPACGDALMHQIAHCLYRLQGWPWVALAEVDHQQVHLRVLSEAGKPKPVFSYPLEESPCRLLYPVGQQADFQVFCNNLKRYPHWRLMQQLPARTYFAQRLGDAIDHRQYHLIALHHLLVDEARLPKTLMSTAMRQIAQDKQRHRESKELLQLQQITQHPSVAMAYVDSRQRLGWASPGLCQLLDSPLNALLLQPVSTLFSSLQGSHLAMCREQPLSLRQHWICANGEHKDLTLSLASLADGVLIHVHDPVHPDLPDSDNQPEQLANRLEQELARLQRKQEVAALLFIEFALSDTQTDPELAVDQLQQLSLPLLQSVVRKEDYVALLGHRLVLLTACFDNQGEVPRNQLTAIADKINQKLAPALRHADFCHSYQIKIRLITSWDSDIEQVLDSDNATVWMSNGANNQEVAITN